MANAILRAVNANCANDFSSTRWPWRYLASTRASSLKHIGWEVTPGGESPTTESTSDNSSESEILTSSSFSESISINTNVEASCLVGLSFKYQAFEDFDISVQYIGSASSGSASSISRDNYPDPNFISSDTGSFSETRTITLPRAVSPASVSLSLRASANGYPYANYPNVNPDNKVLSVSITVALIN